MRGAANPTTLPRDTSSANQKAQDPTEPGGQPLRSSQQSGNLGQETVDAAKALAQEVTSQAKELASNVTDELSTSAKAGVERGSDVMRGFARAMHTAARELDSQSSASAQRVHRAANQIESFSDSIRDRSIGELLSAASDMARRQPTAFVTGAVIAGFALSRFLKSSSTTPFPASGNTTDDANSFAPPGASHRRTSAMAQIDQDRSLIQLVADVVNDIAALFQTEMRLVRTEINEKVSQLAGGSSFVGIGAVALIAALILLLQAIVKWLAIAGLPEEWGLLLVAIVVGIGGFALLMKGINSIKTTTLLPDRTLHQVRADLATVKEHVT